MCSEDSFTGETRTCVMINGDTFAAPVVHIMVDTPYFTGQFNALAVEKPVYDIVVGNITRANRVEKRMKPSHVVKSKEVDIDSKELQRLQESDQCLNKIRK